MKRRSRRRDAFTLLEVLLALTILVGSLAVIGELARLGLRNSQRAAALATAQLHCESKLAEITSGIMAPSAVTSAPLEADPAWVYTVTIEPTPDLGLVAVRVTVAENVPEANNPTEFSLVRWMPESTTTGAEAGATGDSATGSDSAGAAS